MREDKLLLEEEVDLSHILGPGEKGHVDVAYVSKARNTIFVLDYKYGRKYVNAHRNPSLLLYTAGILARQLRKLSLIHI